MGSMCANPVSEAATTPGGTGRLVELDLSLRRADTTAPPWYVLHTRSRQEKAVARALEMQDIEHFLPLRKAVRFYGHRKRTVWQPVFPCYVFLRGTIEATYTAMATGRVASVLDVADQPQLDRELEQIRCAIERGGTLEQHDVLEQGRRVTVTAGPFAGLEGMIEHRSRPDRLILQVEALGQAASLEIDADLLELVD